MLGVGATACVSQELLNPYDKARRDDIAAGLSSGDLGRVAGTIATEVNQVG